jgi:hypothetical protein
MRSQALLILLLPALLGQAPASDDVDPKAKAKRERLREIYLDDAASYIIYRDADRKEKVELRREPVYTWTNPTQTEGQDGHVFVWTARGRAEVIGTVFSTPQTGTRRVIHELHSLSLSTLEVDRPGATGWKPLAPGIELKTLAGSPAPAKSASQRLLQMRALGREFAASATDYQGKRWELRLLPQPLFRYESTDPDVLDGAVFAMVSSAGTDPELILVLEARKWPGQAEPIWQFGAARFSDMGLTVKFRNAVLYEVPLVKWDAPIKDPLRRYHLNVDRKIPPVEEMDAPTTKAQETGRKP